VKPIRIFRHEDWIGAGRVVEALADADLPHEIVSIDHGEPIAQSVDDVSALVFVGCTKSVNDAVPWIDEELALIRTAQARGVPMLGHCFGSQLISKALGGTVFAMPDKEIGWHKVTRSRSPIADAWLHGVPEEFELLIWHHDAFTLPPGAVSLYSSRYCPDQAFVVGDTLATVAHMEVTAPLLRQWLDIYGDDIQPISETVLGMEQILDRLDERVQQMHATVTDRLYDRWLSRVKQADGH
jgi:GMP synthase-like glutamine amidotransferase